MRHYHYNLATRFVSDLKLPIAIISDEETFFYELGLYEEQYKSLSKWSELWETLYKMYPYKTDNQRAELFLQDYYQTRDDIIKFIEESEAYKSFNENKDIIDKYAFKSSFNNVSKSVYNQENIGQRFISVDMKNANFQALRYAGVLPKYSSYKDLVSKFTVNELIDEYVANSKYTRQVIFGKLNPKRQIMVERWLMYQIYEKFFSNEYELCYFGSDEFVMRENGKPISDDEKSSIIASIECEFDGLEVRIEDFSLTGYEFFVQHSDNTEHKLGEFYKRSCDESKFKCIPLPYHKILYKIMTGNEFYINDMDRELMYEKCRVRLVEDIHVKEIVK